MSAPLLEVRGLAPPSTRSTAPGSAVDGVDFTVRRGEVLGLVGESGSGKSVTGFSLVGLIDPPGRDRRRRGAVRGRGSARPRREERLRDLRGNRIAMIFQDPLMTLNPVLSIGEQMSEAILEHRSCSRGRSAGRGRAGAWRVSASPRRRRGLKQYPHEFSGGMRQRVAIAIALLNEPDLIIADEPTTALDVTIQSQILYEVQKLSRETGTAMLWITHDLAVVGELADRVAVMYAGRIVETGPVDDVLDRPRHPYTLRPAQLGRRAWPSPAAG